MRNLVLYTKNTCSLWEVNFAEGLKLQERRCRTKYCRDRMAPYVHIWPEFKDPDLEPEMREPAEHLGWMTPRKMYE